MNWKDYGRLTTALFYDAGTRHAAPALAWDGAFQRIAAVYGPAAGAGYGVLYLRPGQWEYLFQLFARKIWQQ